MSTQQTETNLEQEQVIRIAIREKIKTFLEVQIVRRAGKKI